MLVPAYALHNGDQSSRYTIRDLINHYLLHFKAQTFICKHSINVVFHKKHNVSHVKVVLLWDLKSTL